MKEIKVALIGFGGIARSHNNAYHALKEEGYPISLVAVCDRNAEQFTATKTINLGSDFLPLPEGIHTYTDIDDLIAKEDFDMADICLPSFLHKDFATKLLRAGKHVLCEKPMALCSADCEEMISVAKASGKKLMVGQCLRFDPFYLFLKDCVEKKTFGEIKHLRMERLSEYPTWGEDKWFDDSEKCGGAILDTHIHDIDMARFLLGQPNSVSSIGYVKPSHCQLVNSRLFYDNLTVIADVAWDEARPVPFQAGFHAKFDDASVVFDGEKLLVYPNGGEVYTQKIENKDRIAEEIRLFGDWISSGSTENLVNTPESACASVKLIESLRKSVAQNGALVSL